jgi:hypothetical protein
VPQCSPPVPQLLRRCLCLCRGWPPSLACVSRRDLAVQAGHRPSRPCSSNVALSPANYVNVSWEGRRRVKQACAHRGPPCGARGAEDGDPSGSLAASPASSACAPPSAQSVRARGCYSRAAVRCRMPVRRNGGVQGQAARLLSRHNGDSLRRPDGPAVLLRGADRCCSSERTERSGRCASPSFLDPAKRARAQRSAEVERRWLNVPAASAGRRPPGTHRAGHRQFQPADKLSHTTAPALAADCSASGCVSGPGSAVQSAKSRSPWQGMSGDGAKRRRQGTAHLLTGSHARVGTRALGPRKVAMVARFRCRARHWREEPCCRPGKRPVFPARWLGAKEANRAYRQYESASPRAGACRAAPALCGQRPVACPRRGRVPAAGSSPSQRAWSNSPPNAVS